MQAPSTMPAQSTIRLGKAFQSIAWVLLIPLGFAIAVITNNFALLDWAHVMGAILWTALDIFMGFVLGPILQRLEPSARKLVIGQLMPRMLFLMPIVAITVGWSGWVLGHRLGNFTPSSPAFPWIVAAGIITIVLTVQGIGAILPINVSVFKEVSKTHPNLDKVSRLMRFYRYLVAVQGLLQFVIVAIMVHLAVG
ncbi:MAG: hypothetical protein ACYCT0_07010 [Sulfobacillus sp.]